MNMLTNTTPFCLLKTEEQELFLKLKGGEFYLLQSTGDWLDSFGENSMSFWHEHDRPYSNHTYRLKLKEGEWYYMLKTNSDTVLLKYQNREHREDVLCASEYFKERHVTTGGSWSYDDITEIRPATQEEIDSVKPKPEFKRGDVFTINDSKFMYRIGFSYLNKKNFIFDNDSGVGAIEDSRGFKHATPNQINQLEFEEMKAGKKWNGEGYDDWLTADGLTWNELIKHDTSEIEFEAGKKWRKTLNSKDDRETGIGLSKIKHYRLKTEPEPTFIDVEIDWSGFGPTVKHPNDWLWSLECLGLRAPVKGWFVSKYLFEDGSEIIYPVRIYNNKCSAKATHARFVKLN